MLILGARLGLNKSANDPPDKAINSRQASYRYELGYNLLLGIFCNEILRPTGATYPNQRTTQFIPKGKGVLVMPVPEFEQLAGIAKGARKDDYRDREDRY